MITPRIEFIGVTGLPEIEPGACVGRLVAEACEAQETPLRPGDLLVVTQKIVSKSEGRIANLSDVIPSTFANSFANQSGRDPRLIEIVLRESKNIVRADSERGILIVETRHGLICANAGVDSSNVLGEEIVALLPEDPDRSASDIRRDLLKATGIDIPVIISDTFGRPWREGHVNFAIGMSGIEPFKDYRGLPDSTGERMAVTNIAEIDEIAAAAELVMGKVDGIPAAILRGHSYRTGHSGHAPLLRERSMDLFR